MTLPESVLNLPDDARMLDVVRAGLERADDVRIAVSFTRCSGLQLLIDPLREVADRGGRVRVLTSTYQSVTQPDALETLRRLPRVETRLQTGPVGFHAKFWWFRGATGGECWAGSSNLSKGGLDTNIEWNVRSVDPAAFERTQRQFDGLWVRDDVRELDDELLRAYSESYRRELRSRFDSVPSSAEQYATLAPNGAQREALAALEKLRESGQRRAAVIAATGVGKTYLAAFDAKKSGARTVLYVSHRLEHLVQARESFANVFGLGYSTGLVGGGRDEPRADLVFATVASLARRPELAARPFDYLVIDEFHHAEAPSYRVLRPLRDRAFLLGLTATPERQDGHDVLEWCDWNVAYEIRLPEAIDRGWLLPFHYFGVADETIDFLRIPWRKLSEEQIGSELSVEERADHVLRHALERGFDGPKRATIGFCAGRFHARFMAEAFSRRGQSAVAVLGDDRIEARQAVYRRLADPNDPLEWIFVSDVLNEGVDLPVINSVLFLRPTESVGLFLQQLGRGLRLYPGTEVLTVLDFVGHHQAAWLAFDALNAPNGGGRRTVISDDFVIKPPRACEVVLERRTKEILAKIQRFTSKRDRCEHAYERVRAELGRAPLPIDLWNRADVPPLADFRTAYKSGFACQRSNDDTPEWSRGLSEDHPVFGFLRGIEANWQAQRVSPYALVWGLCAQPHEPRRGYEEFFDRWPMWRGERSELDGSKTWDTVRRKLGPFLEGDRLLPQIREALGAKLLEEVEGRLLYTINGDYQQRHGGTLRTPAELNLFARYERPEIIRHFGVHYDPAKHNTGMLWFADHGVIICKLDTSSATERHQYENALLDERTFSWTSQNRMSVENEAGRKVLEHEGRGLRLHLFVQPRSHAQACYLGAVRVREASGEGPMKVLFELACAVPDDVLRELEERSGDDGVSDV